MLFMPDIPLLRNVGQGQAVAPNAYANRVDEPGRAHAVRAFMPQRVLRVRHPS